MGTTIAGKGSLGAAQSGDLLPVDRAGTDGNVTAQSIADLASGGSGVPSVNGITGAVTIAAGTGIDVDTTGSTITIAATGGGGGLEGFAYDPETSDLPAGIIGITAGIVTDDDEASEKAGQTRDLSMEPDGAYYLYLTPDSANLAIVEESAAQLAGVTTIQYLEVVSGAITFNQDVRTWAHNSATLANLAAEETAKGTQTVIDQNNILSFEEITTQAAPDVTTLSGLVYSYEMTSAGSDAPELLNSNATQIAGQGLFLYFGDKTSAGDSIVIDDIAGFILPSATVTAIEFTDEDQFLFATANADDKWVIDLTNTSPGVVTSTPFGLSDLPSAADAGFGARYTIDDALLPTFGAAAADGGAVTVPVYSDGIIWRVG